MSIHIIKELSDGMSMHTYSDDVNYYLFDKYDQEYGPFKSEAEAEEYSKRVFKENNPIDVDKDEVNQALTLINGVIEICRESIIDGQDFVYLPLEQIELLAKAADRIDKVNNKDK